MTCVEINGYGLYMGGPKLLVFSLGRPDIPIYDQFNLFLNIVKELLCFYLLIKHISETLESKLPEISSLVPVRVLSRSPVRVSKA